MSTLSRFVPAFNIFVRQLAVQTSDKVIGSAVMPTNPKAECRLSPINHAYLDDLAKLGPYGSGKSGVMRRFIENGIKAALESKVIEPRSVADFGGPSEDGDD